MVRVRTLESAKRDIKRHLDFKSSKQRKSEFLTSVATFRDTLKVIPVSGRSLGHDFLGAEFFARLWNTDYLWIWSYMPGTLDTEDLRTGCVSLVRLYHFSELRRASSDVRRLEDLPTLSVD